MQFRFWIISSKTQANLMANCTVMQDMVMYVVKISREDYEINDKATPAGQIGKGIVTALRLPLQV